MTRFQVSLLLTALALLPFSPGCTDAGLYSAKGNGKSGPDRAMFEGIACVPLAAGDQFPVKVIYALQGGEGVDRNVVAQAVDSLGSLSQRYLLDNLKFSLVAFHTVATGLQGNFVPAVDLQSAVQKYNSYQEVGPVSLRAPLLLSKSLISGDILTGCKGTVERTRYVVVLMVVSPDTSCANPNFNAGIHAECNQFILDGVPNAQALCSQCELTQVTEELKALSERYAVGEVTVQPIYVSDTPDPNVAAQVAAIAKSGGSKEIQTDVAHLSATLSSLDFSSLQRNLTLKRLIAFNRNVSVRNGQMLVDSDGDGLSDAEEDARGTKKLVADADGDGLSDGLEVKMGLNPLVFDLINGCNPFLDSDGDRLNDCEERVLGTDTCVADSDGDGLPDMVELHSSTNPLTAEDLADADQDGFSNLEEVQAHTDPISVDIAFHNERGYQYEIEPADPTPDGRPCYQIRASNISLMTTEQHPNPPFADVPAGTNDLYLYLQVGRDNDPHGTGIGSLVVRQITYVPPDQRSPSGTVKVVPEDFVVGN